MAHLLDESRGRAACMVVGEAAWHRLGVRIDQAVTGEEAWKLALLDFWVEKRPVFTATGRPVPNVFATVRTDTEAVLGAVGSQYRPFQNRDAFTFMDAVVGQKLAMYESAGAIRGGRRIWVMARIPKTLRAAGQDVIQPYALFTNTHDGSSALRVLPTDVRVVCNNTLTLALSRKRGGRQGIAIRHTESLEARVEAARESLGVITERLDEHQEEIDALVHRTLKAAESRAYFESLFPTRLRPAAAAIAADGVLDQIVAQQMDRGAIVAELLAGHFARSEDEAARNRTVLESILENFHNERNTLPGIEGTAWAAYNAVSEWADHQRTVRGRDEAARADNHLHSVWFGPANDVKQQAWAGALALAV